MHSRLEAHSSVYALCSVFSKYHPPPSESRTNELNPYEPGLNKKTGSDNTALTQTLQTQFIRLYILSDIQ